MHKRVSRHAVEQPLDQSIKFIPLTHGENTIVDSEVYEFLMQWPWNIRATRGKKYVQRTGTYGESEKTYLMHRVIMGLAKGDGLLVDHINGNPLDNRKSNLRKCTHVQNMYNRAISKSNKSGMKGVCSCGKKWKAYIQKSGKTIHIGYFHSKEDADNAYRAKASELFGEFASS